MVVVVAQSRIYLRQGEVIFSRDFIGTEPYALVPDDDVLHRDTMACDMGLTSGYTRLYLDMSA
jgi:hypothetical protein